MTKRIITISRELGSSGRFIGEEVAKKLGVVDRNFIRKPADYGIVICHDSDCIRENV